MTRHTIAIFLSPLGIERQGQRSLISRADIGLINALATRYHIDVFCDSPLPDNRSELLVPCLHYLIFMKNLRKRSYANVLYLLWGTGRNRYLFTMISLYPGILVLRDRNCFFGLSRHYLLKNDFRVYASEMQSTFGAVGRLLAASQFLGIPCGFLEQNVEIERYFAKTSRRVITNYVPTAFCRERYDSCSISHPSLFASDRRAVQVTSSFQGPFRIAVFSDMIPAVIAHVIYSAVSLMVDDGFGCQVTFLGEMEEPLTKEEWREKSHYSHIKIETIDGRQPFSFQLERCLDSDCIIVFSAYSPFQATTMTSELLTALDVGCPVITFHSGSMAHISHRNLSVFLFGEDTAYQLKETLERFRHEKSEGASMFAGESWTKQTLCGLDDVVEKYFFHLDSTIASHRIVLRANETWTQISRELITTIDEIISEKHRREMLDSLKDMTGNFLPGRIDPQKFT